METQNITLYSSAVGCHHLLSEIFAVTRSTLDSLSITVKSRDNLLSTYREDWGIRPLSKSRTKNSGLTTSIKDVQIFDGAVLTLLVFSMNRTLLTSHDSRHHPHTKRSSFRRVLLTSKQKVVRVSVWILGARLDARQSSGFL